MDLSGVPETLLITLYCRAVESQRSGARVKDERAAERMSRVARPGTKIAIADENEKAAQSLDRLPGFERLFEKKRETVTTPVDLLPAAMQEIRADSIWKGTDWVVDFRKPG